MLLVVIVVGVKIAEMLNSQFRTEIRLTRSLKREK